MEITRICPACYLLRVPDAGISWVFNAWPDLAKFLIQQELAIDGIVYPDLRMQSDQGISCNLIEFPLLHALFHRGMYFREERPCLVGTKRQLELATGLEGHRLTTPDQRHEVAILLEGAPGTSLGQRLQDRVDAPRALVRQGAPVRPSEGELLVPGPQTPVAGRLAARLQPGHELVPAGDRCSEGFWGVDGAQSQTGSGSGGSETGRPR